MYMSADPLVISYIYLLEEGGRVGFFGTLKFLEFLLKNEMHDLW